MATRLGGTIVPLIFLRGEKQVLLDPFVILHLNDVAREEPRPQSR